MLMMTKLYYIRNIRENYYRIFLYGLSFIFIAIIVSNSSISVSDGLYLTLENNTIDINTTIRDDNFLTQSDIIKYLHNNGYNIKIGVVTYFKFESICQNETQTIIYIGLDQTLREKIGLSNKTYVDNPANVGNYSILFANSSILKVSDILPSIVRLDYIRDIFDEIQSDIQVFTNYKIILGTQLLGNNLLSTNQTIFNTNPDYYDNKLSYHYKLLSFFEKNWYTGKSLDGIKDYIFERKKYIADLFIVNSFEEDINYYLHSNLDSIIEQYEQDISTQISIIQILSIPNLVVVFGLYAIMNVEKSDLEREIKLLWSRGQSFRNIKLSILIIEIVNLIIAYIVSMLLIIPITYSHNYSTSILKTFLVSSIVNSIIILIINSIAILSISLKNNSIVDNKSQLKKQKFSDMLLSKFLGISLFTILSFLLIHNFILISSIFDIIIIIIIILMLVRVMFNKFNKNYVYLPKNEAIVVSMIKRLQRVGIKRFHKQKILILLFFMTFSFIICSHIIITSENNKQINNPIGDIVVSYEDTQLFETEPVIYSFSQSNLTSLNNLKEISEIVPVVDIHSSFSSNGVNFDNTLISYDINFLIANQKYNHFYSNQNFSSNSNGVLISQDIALYYNLKIGDEITIMLNEIIKFSDNSTTINYNMKIDNLIINGIVDTYNILNEYISGIFYDLKLLNKEFEENNLPSIRNKFIIELENYYKKDFDNSTFLQNLSIKISNSLNISDNNLSYKYAYNSINIPKNESVNTYVILNFILLLLLIPTTTYIFSVRVVKNIKNDLFIMGSRGVSDTTMRKTYIETIHNELSRSIVDGIISGIILTYTYSLLPGTHNIKLLASSYEIHLIILAVALILYQIFPMINKIILNSISKEIKTFKTNW